MNPISPLPRLLITGVPTAAALAYAAQHFELTVWREAEPLAASLPRLLQWAQGQDAILAMPNDKLDAAAIAALPASIRALATHSVGTDHIDLAAATARRLPVFYTPDVLTEAVADTALFLIIAAARDTTAAERTLRAGQWGPWAPTSMMGRSLQSMRLGILGLGRIGAAVAARARPFGLQIHYHNRSRVSLEQEGGATYHATLDALMANSDVLCLCAPATAELRGCIDARRLSLLPRGAALVNVGRGDLIEEEALFAAVHSGQLGAVANDVYRNEPRIDPRWLALPRTTLLPHIGSATQEVRTAMGCLAVDGLHSVFTGVAGGRCVNGAVLRAA